MLRISECREHARQCRSLARRVNTDMRAELLETAEMWDALADDREAYGRKLEIGAYIRKWDAR